MLPNTSFAQVLKVLREVQTELGQAPVSEKIFPPLTDVLAQVGPIPRDALLLGMDGDGLPVLLSLRDPDSGPILLVSDRGCGKTIFLQVLARSVMQLFPAEEIGLVVLTRFPGEWQELESAPHLMGIFPVYEPVSLDLLYDLACRAETGTTDRSILLLFDGLDFASRMNPAGQDNLRYLLAYGPQAHIWPIVSVNALRTVKMPDWLSYFHTRIYGHIGHRELADELTPLPGAELDSLLPVAQFSIRKKSQWLKFWLPGL